MKLPWNKDVWFSPNYAVHYFDRIKKLKGDKALTNKKYPKEYALIIYLQRSEYLPDLDKLSQEISNIKPEIADIWCLGRIDPVDDNFIFFSLYPEYIRTEYNFLEEVKKLVPGDFIEMHRSGKDKMEKISTNDEHRFIPTK